MCGGLEWSCLWDIDDEAGTYIVDGEEWTRSG